MKTKRDVISFSQLWAGCDAIGADLVKLMLSPLSAVNKQHMNARATRMGRLPGSARLALGPGVPRSGTNGRVKKVAAAVAAVAAVAADLSNTNITKLASSNRASLLASMLIPFRFRGHRESRVAHIGEASTIDGGGGGDDDDDDWQLSAFGNCVQLPLWRVGARALNGPTSSHRRRYFGQLSSSGPSDTSSAAIQSACRAVSWGASFQLN